MELFDKFGIVRELVRTAVQKFATEVAVMFLAAAIMEAVQCVVSPGGTVIVSDTTLSITADFKGEIRKGRVLSRNRPSTPAAIKRLPVIFPSS